MKFRKSPFESIRKEFEVVNNPFIFLTNLLQAKTVFLFAAIGQRARNYLSCCCSCSSRFTTYPHWKVFKLKEICHDEIQTGVLLHASHDCYHSAVPPILWVSRERIEPRSEPERVIKFHKPYLFLSNEMKWPRAMSLPTTLGLRCFKQPRWLDNVAQDWGKINSSVHAWQPCALPLEPKCLCKSIWERWPMKVRKY